jgi:hypothetical protein
MRFNVLFIEPGFEAATASWYTAKWGPGGSIDADSLDAYHVQRLEPAKRTAFVVALLHVKTAKALDDLGNLVCRRVAAIRTKARKAEAYKLARQNRADEPVRTLKEVVSAHQGESAALERFSGVETIIGHRAEALIIGYYYTLNTYIVLFRRFIPCGVFETTYILDGPPEKDYDSSCAEPEENGQAFHENRPL